MKGLTPKGIVRLQERGYNIIPIPTKNECQKSFKLLKNEAKILEVHFDPCNEETSELEEASGTISVKEGQIRFKKLIGLYVTDEGVVLDYEDEKGKAKVVKETTEGWII